MCVHVQTRDFPLLPRGALGLALHLREYNGQPWGFFGQPAPVPGKTRTRSHGCGFPMGTGVGFHETHVSDVPGNEYIKTRFRPIKTRHSF